MPVRPTALGPTAAQLGVNECGEPGSSRMVLTAGRPWPPAKDERFTLRVDAQTLELWREFAGEQEVGVSELVTVAVEHYRVRSQTSPRAERERHFHTRCSVIGAFTLVHSRASSIACWLRLWTCSNTNVRTFSGNS